MANHPPGQGRSSSIAALRIALIYILIAGLWITFSDQVVDRLGLNPAGITRVQTYKGWGFVVTMGVLLFLERQQAERRNHENIRLRAQTQSIFDLAPNPVLIIELDTLELIAANQSATQTFGPATGQIFRQIFASAQAERSAHDQQQLDAQVRSAEPVRFTSRATLEDGKSFFLDVAVRGITWQGRNAAIVIIADITERKRYEETILRLNEELEQHVAARTAALEAKNKELETFTYSVSHDLKAPLRGIDGYSRLLLDDHAASLDEEGRHFLHTIRQATARMNQLIDDLLAYSRLERRALAISQLDPNILVDTCVQERSEEIRARQIDLVVNIPYPQLTADSESLGHALRNLLDNALKFTRDTPNPRIEIGGEETPTSYRLWVRDNGPGFDMKHHDRIFEIFQRLHRNDEYPGTGIGLAIVRKAMERAGGRAWAESEPEKGATFYLEIWKPK